MPDGYSHDALPYAGHASFVSSCVDVVHEGLERDEAPIVLALSEKLDAVNDALGTDAADVTFVPTDEHGRNPSRITTMLHSFQAASDGRHCLGVNESVLSSRTSAAQDEARMSEFLLNDRSLRSWPLSVVCLYDTGALGPAALDSMRQSHAVVRGVERNAEYLPDRAASLYAGDLEPAPDDAVRLQTRSHQLTQMRAFVRTTASGHGIASERVDDFVLAANEIVTNSLRHGGGQAMLAMWFADGAAVCEVRDRGHIPDPMTGRLAPSPTATSGRGIWLANHLCDLVQLRSSAAAGTVVRLHVDRL